MSLRTTAHYNAIQLYLCIMGNCIAVGTQYVWVSWWGECSSSGHVIRGDSMEVDFF